MKIFEIRYTDKNEQEWVCANSLIHALRVYCSITGMDLIEFEENDEIIEIPEAQWHTYTIQDENGKVVKTFRQYMDENVNNEADIIAGTPYLSKN